jgi:hypothetical protein
VNDARHELDREEARVTAKRRDDLRTKSNFLRRRRIAKAAEDLANGRKDTERRGSPNDVPAPRKERGRV